MFKESIASAIAKKTGVGKEQILKAIEIPPSNFGDLSLPCFIFSSKLKKNAADIAAELSRMKFPKEIEKAEARGPYLNFFVSKGVLASSAINDILRKKEKFGMNGLKKGKKIMVEYSSPNTNKPLHLGHLKNNSIGMAVSNILEFSGASVIKSNLLNDRGIHICKVMYAYRHLSKQKHPDKNQKPDHFVGNLYVLFSQKASDKITEEAQEMLQKWERKDKSTRELWKKIGKWAENGIFQTYKTFGSEFDVIFRESQFYNKAKDIIKNGLKKKIFSKEDGAVIAKLDPLPDKPVLRRDGTSLYITNDLALTRHKFEKYKLSESVWITGSEQKLYFEQLFRIFFLLGFKFFSKCRHLPYGMVLLAGGKMKSREGKVVDADNFIAEITELAKKEIEKRDKNIKNKELDKRAKAVALAAIKFYLLKIDPAKDVLFEPEKAVSFEGYTGPYLQYAYVRASNILKKARENRKEKADYSLLKTDEEIELVRKLSQFEETVKLAASKLKPDMIANYAYQLSQTFANFYEKCPVMKAEKEKAARIALVRAFKQVLENSLRLLGIDLLERM